ncbi:PAS/PAC sensor hybrid histidine kinase [Paraphoma chrysanthemicola]|uniref:PAS/PAC sensor hybrid histidine kinase n=1 Tax=Paraphoma chrysanthemicola TaxID=798071 RepID=A0A8K0R1V9_9PLEO|nr:PAS/PAC sensor hybrid histidine kinase [Paraphoma chrysanthemicola]
MTTVAAVDARRIVPHWNFSLVLASIAVSFLGAFTSTQLIVQAKTSRYLSAVIVWSILASLTFGFCSIWCLHFIAMLACELDLPITLNVSLTILSAILAVGFTWLALAFDLVWERYKKIRRLQAAALRKDARRIQSLRSCDRVLEAPSARGGRKLNSIPHNELQSSFPRIETHTSRNQRTLSPFPGQASGDSNLSHDPLLASTIDAQSVPLLARTESQDGDDDGAESDANGTRTNSLSSWTDFGNSRRSSGVTSSDTSLGLGRFASVRKAAGTTFGERNPFIATALALYMGLTARNTGKGFVWSLAITGMHYSGILALDIPHGFCDLDVKFVILSAIISWIVCVVGCILLSSMETRLGQQVLFSIIATTGVASMHFTGMHAASFWSTDLPSETRGYPSALVVAISCIAITTCLAANGLLAHSTTLARNKLAEIIYTRKNLWAAIAQKENAEAAAIARSEFIASASHEIRSPIHQLQGYSDLLARSNLDDESRLLLHAMQDAIRSLSLITTTVLDWSRLEQGEAVCRPTAVDVRRLCESVLNVLPRRDEDCDVELLILVAPDVPDSLFIDETYLHRIVMNLLSNSLKFTSSGHVLLQIKLIDQDMVVTVKDTGNGIPEAFLPDLFEPFKQAQSRGPQRGTGLGLSIVKQLLQKMDGTIDTESKDRNDFPDHSGTIFTATFPVQLAAENCSCHPRLSGKLGLLGATGCRALEGVGQCCSLYGLDTIVLDSRKPVISDLDYVWASLEFLRSNQAVFRSLRDREDIITLIPYDDDKALLALIGNSPGLNILPLRRPLLFHKMAPLMTDPSRKAIRPDALSRTVRFASVVNLFDGGEGSESPSKVALSTRDTCMSESAETIAAPAKTILLVEDNKVNQRLGLKMLKTLGYEVIIANDGQEAVDLVIEHANDIDAILMDQSMPVKDGLTATREIREIEADGKLPQQRGRPMPIIAVTAVVGTHAESMCRQAGADDFLPKPLSLSMLRQTLEAFLMDFGDK